MNDITIRSANIQDAADILKIYEYYVKETAISFEYDVPTLDEMKARITKTLRKYPYFVAVQNNRIIGYAYAGAFIGRAAYDYSAELTIYIDKDSRNSGAGRKLYEALEDALQKMGITNLYACIGYPDAEDEYLNFNSANFHAHMGFTKCGEFHKCGYKFGRWYHMIWMEKIIGQHISK
ncbi:MAG: GNAT family N-acetyltransferase [Bacillus sp. (in: Bacteria)]|nr:GNAT family N-acetyltransferase [Bacillus sp. (in: firmicutes)]MCM1427935.1 GNAT family N-acetyltransferase [Eubacterium sp.]